MPKIDFKSALLGAALVLSSSFAVDRSLESTLHIFKPGKPILASEVNANFASLAAAVRQAQASASNRFFQTDGDFAAGVIPGNGYNSGAGPFCTIGDVWLSAARVSGSLPLQGQVLNISQNEALYSLLGTRYGGDGKTTFALPDLRTVTPKSSNGQALTYVICTAGIFP